MNGWRWMLLKPLIRRILPLIIVGGLLVCVVAAGTEAILAIGTILCLVHYLFLLPNIGMIITAKQGMTFKLVNAGIFAAYFVPLTVAFFYSDKPIFIPVAIFLHFFYLIFALGRGRRNAAWTGVKFVITMFAMFVICTIVWDVVVVDSLYDNTDDNMLGFLHPFFRDGWIGQGNFPVVAVDHVVPGRSMSDPDEIKKGWTITDLWLLWFSFIGVSVVISIGAAWLPWMPHQRINT